MLIVQIILVMFEIHITTNAVLQKDIPAYITFCESIEAKPIIIELQEGETAQQPMISKVVKSDRVADIPIWIERLTKQFEANNYPVKRVKVEVPLEYIYLGEIAFPEYKGKYFEWHGKFIFENEEELDQARRTAISLGAHLSRNSLKGESNKRFITVRTYGNEYAFKSAVNRLKNSLYIKPLDLEKEEYEYCIYDSNKVIDKGWINTPEITDQEYLFLIAAEGFLRRASQVNAPFMLKGSLLTRQYMANKNLRQTRDLDFVYLDYINPYDEKGAADIFSKWITEVLRVKLDDGVHFEESDGGDHHYFLQNVQYAMHDDFPTANTLVYCMIGNQSVDISLDISWNLPIGDNKIPLLYSPQSGEAFEVPYTVPLALQISWKLHQSIVRTRVKDLVDVILLLEDNKVDDQLRLSIAEHLFAECKKDKIDPRRIEAFENGKVSKLYVNLTAEDIRQMLARPYITPYGFHLATGFSKMQIHPLLVHRFQSVQQIIEQFEEHLHVLDLSSLMNEMTKSNKQANSYLKSKGNFWKQILDNLN